MIWKNHVQPVLAKSCFKCHGGEKQKGGLDLREPNSIFAGGTDGSVVVPGRPGESMLYQRLMPGADDHMPPLKEQQLTSDDISFIREWIATLPTSNDKGYQLSPIFTQTAPTLLETAAKGKWKAPAGVGPSQAIDQMIQAHWKDQHVEGNGVCDDRTFVRRIYIDLAGRIPTPTEAEEFINSTETDKRATLVDKLMAGSEYNKHMAEVLDISLMDRRGRAAESSRRSNGWFDYL